MSTCSPPSTLSRLTVNGSHCCTYNFTIRCLYHHFENLSLSLSLSVSDFVISFSGFIFVFTAVTIAAQNDSHVDPPKSTPTSSASSVTTDVVPLSLVSGRRPVFHRLPVLGICPLRTRYPVSEWAVTELIAFQVAVQSRNRLSLSSRLSISGNILTPPPYFGYICSVKCTSSVGKLSSVNSKLMSAVKRQVNVICLLEMKSGVMKSSGVT